MDDEFRLKNALDTAWAVHLATRREVDAADPRRCSLSACWQKQFGRTDLLRPVLSCSVRLRELVKAGWHNSQRLSSAWLLEVPGRVGRWG